MELATGGMDGQVVGIDLAVCTRVAYCTHTKCDDWFPY